MRERKGGEGGNTTVVYNVQNEEKRCVIANNCSKLCFRAYACINIHKIKQLYPHSSKPPSLTIIFIQAQGHTPAVLCTSKSAARLHP